MNEIRKRICSAGLLMLCLGAVIITCRRTEEISAEGVPGLVCDVEMKNLSDSANEPEGTDSAENPGTDNQTEDSEAAGSTENRESEPDKTASPETQSLLTITYDEKTVPPRFSEEAVPVAYTDDLSLLENMDAECHSYAYLDGKVYYRQYHEDSFKEGGLWADYAPVPGTEKEMVCIDKDGVKTELFKDKGNGEFYLSGGRFYMTEFNDSLDPNIERHLYSVDREGNDRIDYGQGIIQAFDEKRNVFILEMYESYVAGKEYCVLDCSTSTCRSLFSEERDLNGKDGWLSFCDYQDGWIYLEFLQRDRKNTELYAVSLEGEWEKLLTLTSNPELLYPEYIVHFEAADDRLFMTYGGFDGSEQVYQGGKIISVKRDGTEYRSVWDQGFAEPYRFYLKKDSGGTLVYFPTTCKVNPDEKDEEIYPVTVWDSEKGMLHPSKIPAPLVYNHKYFYVDDDNDVWALPDDSGRVVKVAEHLDRYIEPYTDRTEEDGVSYNFSELYYRDGYLYFIIEYSVWSKEESIGWRDGYRRVRTEAYRLKTGQEKEEKAELLYYY